MLSIKQWERLSRDSEIRKAFLRQPLVLDNHDLSPKDKMRCFDAFIKWMVVIGESAETLDSTDLGTCANQFCRVYSDANLVRFLCEISKCDIGKLQEQLKNCLLALRHLSLKKGDLTYDSYESWLESFEVEKSYFAVNFLSFLLRLVYKTQNGILYFVLNTILQFTTRLTLKDVDWIEDDEMSSYIQFEDTLKHQVYDLQLINELREVAWDWFHDFKFIEDIVPQHGYGATAEVRRSGGTEQKYKNFVRYRGIGMLAYHLNWNPGLHLYDDLPLFLDDDFYACLTDEVTDDIPSSTDLKMVYNLVPKGINKKRGVSQEPTTKMFFQKIASQSFDRHFQEHPFMGIDLHDQDRSRDLCLSSTYTYRYGTMDLSSASDSVTYSLVKAVFSKFWFWPVLELCRTSWCTLDYQGTKRTIALEKYAPMGSALCFPMECTIFAMICEVASRRKGLYNKQMYVVYGDDLIVHDLIYDEVLLLLTKLNFIVNYDKSYTPEDDFKEACGMEAYRGFDVSPLRISRKWDICQLWGRRDPTATILTASYDAANEAMLFGYPKLRHLIIQQTLDQYPGAQFTYDGNCGFYSTSENLNGHLRTRWNSDEQRLEMKCQVVRSDLSRGNDNLRYSLVLEKYDCSKRTQLLDPEDRVEVKCGAAHSYTKWMWVPAVL